MRISSTIKMDWFFLSGIIEWSRLNGHCIQKEESKFSKQVRVKMDYKELHIPQGKRESVNIERKNEKKKANREFRFADKAPL